MNDQTKKLKILNPLFISVPLIFFLDIIGLFVYFKSFWPNMFLDNLPDSPISLVFSIISIILSLLINLQLIDNFQLYFDKKLIFENHEYWRAFTSIFCFGSLSTGTVINLVFFVRSLTYAESSFFSGQPADFILFSLFGWIVIWAYACFHPTLFLGQFFNSYVTYYFYKRSPDVHIVVVGIVALAPYVPIIMLAINLLFNGARSLLMDIIGFSAAHMFFFIKDELGLRYNIRVLCAPQWANEGLKKLLS